MFLINSRLGHFTAPQTSWGLLLPKLRSKFAEFLNEGSLDHLRVLPPPTRVGLRYGHLQLLDNGIFLTMWNGGIALGCPATSPRKGRTMSNRHAQLSTLCPPIISNEAQVVLEY